jgi:adenine-specific DNA-methyltransferase
MEPEQYDYIIGNPPYVSIMGLGEREKQRFRQAYGTATGRFDLYCLFFEQGLRNLRAGGRLTFITPEKFLYVESASALRRLMAGFQVEEILFVDEETFSGLVTYPTITTLTKRPAHSPTQVVMRNGGARKANLPRTGASWLPVVRGETSSSSGPRLEDIVLRTSCGVATGADAVFVVKTAEVPRDLRPFAYPTLAGRELTPEVTEPRGKSSMLVPYDRRGDLVRIEALGALGEYLSRPHIRARLEERTCADRKPWHAFHETPPLTELLRPKILCKDITAKPRFWIDRTGTIVPRHSVYYIVPRDAGQINALAAHLNSETAGAWLDNHCQRAANGFLRLQSTTLKKIPIPRSLFNVKATLPMKTVPSARHRALALEVLT